MFYRRHQNLYFDQILTEITHVFKFIHILENYKKIDPFICKIFALNNGVIDTPGEWFW